MNETNAPLIPVSMLNEYVYCPRKLAVMAGERAVFPEPGGSGLIEAAAARELTLMPVSAPNSSPAHSPAPQVLPRQPID